ncbi:VOC family protein [Gordonia soli]|uniref:Glyoxalase-like domain-containing protein n=1 Tax=Gordonia soli NBRC 108243 TaxID=1223545 RepID=M0QNR8_9ACTN|nr:VOC family protein [Gordonia soli]GAC70223.1 hypothetical protein GS4_33_00370 [Gordonia soli NBRC 108243]
MPDTTVSFDHLIHWVDDLDDAVAGYRAAGFPVDMALAMPGFRNAAWGVDDARYVELATVDDWDAVTTSPYARGVAALRPGIDALDGSGLLTFAVDVPDTRAVGDRLQAAGHEIEVVEVHFAEQNAGFVEVFVRDVPPHFPFFITYDPPRAELARRRAEHRAAEGITSAGRPDLVALLVRTDDPEADAQRMADFVGCARSANTVRLAGAEIRFVAGAPSGLHGFVVRGRERTGEQFSVAGATLVDG